MKNYIFYICILFFLVTVFCIPSVSSSKSGVEQAGTVLHSASELDYPPFAIVLPDGTADGFSVDLLREVAIASGMEIQFEVGPWNVIKQKLADGELDVLPLVSYSKERDKIFDFTAPYLRMHGTIFIRKNEKHITGIDDLKDKSVLVMRGDTAHEYALRENITENLILTDSFEEAMRKLSSGQYDAVIIQQVVGHQIIKKLGIENVTDVEHFGAGSIQQAGGPLSGFEQKFCIAVKEGNRELLAALNEGLAIVIANGTYDELYNKWFEPIMPHPPIPIVLIVKYSLLIVGPLVFILAIFGVWYLKREVTRKTVTLSNEIEQRKKIEKELLETQSHLEEKVKNRTEELEKMNEMQKSQMKMLAENNRELKDFVHVASHDLQEPLRKIQTFADRIVMIGNNNVDEHILDYIIRMQAAAGRMHSLVLSLLNYSRITSNTVEFSWINLSEIVEEAVSDLDILLTETKGIVEYIGLPEIHADRVQMRQLFENLIANSLKFHDSKRPEVKISCINDETVDFCEIMVEDNGIGFENKYRDQIFKPFRRLHHKDSSYRGTGIGLSICRRIVERHGGIITADGNPGKGAVFNIRLPKIRVREGEKN